MKRGRTAEGGCGEGARDRSLRLVTPFCVLAGDRGLPTASGDSSDSLFAIKVPFKTVV